MTRKISIILISLCILYIRLFNPFISILMGKHGYQHLKSSWLSTTNVPPNSDPTADWPPVTGPDPSTRMAAFYYPWYFTPEFDGRWDHWEGNPPEDISSDYYPLLGPYSMSDPEVLAQHFAWLRQAGVGLIISSWWGK